MFRWLASSLSIWLSSAASISMVNRRIWSQNANAAWLFRKSSCSWSESRPLRSTAETEYRKICTLRLLLNPQTFGSPDWRKSSTSSPPSIDPPPIFYHFTLWYHFCHLGFLLYPFLVYNLVSMSLHKVIYTTGSPDSTISIAFRAVSCHR